MPFVGRSDRLRDRNPSGYRGNVAAALDLEQGGVEEPIVEPGFIAIDSRAVRVRMACGDEFVVQDRLDDRHPAPASGDQWRDRKLRVELVGVNDVGLELA